MSVSQARKHEIISQYMIGEGDTGSPEIQVAVLTERISVLASHMSRHPKDFHSSRGLVGAVNRRRKLLSYLKAKSLRRYEELIEKAGLRH